MIPTIRVALSLIALTLALGAADAAEKQYGPGINDTAIKLGQTVPYSGPASAF